jgi:FkbH-like protein
VVPGHCRSSGLVSARTGRVWSMDHKSLAGVALMEGTGRSVILRSDGSSPPPLDDTHYNSPIKVLGREAAADFLWLWLQTGDATYTDLYLGICLADLAEIEDLAADEPIDWAPRSQALVSAVAERHPLDLVRREKLERRLTELHQELPTRRGMLREMHLLFLGDCLFEEVALFLAADALRHGLLLRAKHVISKNPIEQRRQIKAVNASKTNAVFYSPFTYSFNTDFSLLLEPRSALASSTQIREATGHVVQSVQRNIDLLADTFECPVFISNASALQRGTSLWKRAGKAALTVRTRARTSNLLNFWLPQYLNSVNQRSFRHLYLLDEASVAPIGLAQLELGTYLHTLAGLHPTRFSQALAKLVAERAVAISLLSRKTVVCDLDNTLWDGIIGEGVGVRHYLDRQRILLRLKEKGVVLTIASKNDPAKVSWKGGALDERSFVASEVSWAPKVQGIQRIYKSLNIKPKDGVFIDDRADERAMVSERWPDMFVADPCDERTWRIFALWADLLDDEQEFDRTQMYQQREQRESGLSPTDDAAEVAAMFGRLGLKAILRKADKPDLKRVSELINRTNQWNLSAARTSFREVERWSTSPDHTILTVQVNDKFGSMGTVCVALVHQTDDSLEIPIFVLSCRVFGFGVETLVLDYVKRRAEVLFGAPNVRGFFTATEHNAPCKDMYREHGYIERGNVWQFAIAPETKALPVWMEVSGFET